MKKFISLLLSIIMIFSVFTCVDLSVFAATDGNYEYDVVNGEAVITKYKSIWTSSLTIASTLGGYPVTGIGKSAFQGCTSLKTVTINNGVTSIGANAFSGCTSLTSIKIPASVKTIGNKFLYNCKKLVSINVDEDNASFCSENGVLFDKNKLTLLQYPIGSLSESYSVPSTVKSIADYAFSDCQNISSVTIPSSVTDIGEGAFNCTSLTAVTLSSNVKQIKAKTFCSCKKLTSIVIPKSALSIGDSAFLQCEALTSVTFGSGPENIGTNAFAGCIALKSVKIPASTKSIDDSAFLDCKALTSVTIGANVTNIGKTAFKNCSALKSITIPKNVVSIGKSAFQGCSALTSATIGEGVTLIDNDAFSGCTSLTSIKIPAKVDTIGTKVFFNCKSLTNISVDSANANYCSENGVLFDKNKLTLLQYPLANSVNSYTIPDTVNSVAAYAFAYDQNLENITIPNSVSDIGVAAFQYSHIKSVMLPDQLTQINDEVFRSCSNLKEIVIPVSVSIIGDKAFEICNSLKNVHYMGSKTNWLFVSIGETNTCLTNAAFDYNRRVAFFDANSGECEQTSMLATYNYSYGDLPTPTKKGYTFSGWYTTASGGSKITSSTTVTADSYHTLYAHWTANTYTVNYYSDSVKVGSSSHTYGTSKKLTTISNLGALKSGYTFAGWAKTNGSAEVKYTDGQSVSKLTSTNKGTVNLYAVWSVNKYTVSYNANGGSCSTSSKQVTFDSKYGTLPTPTRTGYKFKGWYTKASGGSKVTSNTIVSNAANHTLYAQWTALPKTATVSKAPTKTTYYIGDSISINGISVTITYYDNSTKTVSASSLSFSGNTNSADNNKDLTVSYTENGTTVSATTKITVKTPSAKTYINGEESDENNLLGTGVFSAETKPSGLEVTWTSKNPEIVSIDKFSGYYEVKSLGDTVIQAVFVYNGITYKKDVIISVKGIAENVTNVKPAKTKYYIGDSFNNKLSFHVVFDDGTEKDIANHEGPSGNTKTAGKKTITFNYFGATVSYTYTVVEKAATLSASLSSTKFTYSGSPNTPTLTVKDSSGRTLKKGTDYTVSGNASKTACGVYNMKVKFKGAYEGEKNLTWVVVPKAVKTTIKLYGYDDVQINWDKVTGAQGYRVYYKKSTDSSWKSKDVTTNSAKLSNLTDGVKYQIRVRGFVKSDSGKVYTSNASTNTPTIYTLKKISTPKVSKYDSGKVKVSWTNINGESGYQISKSTSKTGTNVVSTYSTTDGSSKVISASKGTTYYYKVRAYKTVDGKKIYGPWSDVKSYKLS